MAKQTVAGQVIERTGQALKDKAPLERYVERRAARERVAGGKPGGFSANGGVVTKLKMLAIEGAAVNHTPSLFD